MALWGKKDTVYSTGNVNVNVTTGVVSRQSGAIAWTGVSVGDVITIDGTSEGVILSIDDTGPGAGAQITITTEYLPSSDISNKGYEIRQNPKYTLFDSNYTAGEIYGVDVAEAQTARAASGDARKYKPACSGWVGITSYTDMHGNFRVKTETLVAGGGDGFILSLIHI